MCPAEWPGAKDFRQERSRTTADVDHAAHRFPAAGDQHLRVRNAVPSRSHQRVEARGDLRMGLQILPERTAEDR